jgi:Biotin/lipoate A/B protein ligase family
MAASAGRRTQGSRIAIDLPPPFRLLKLREVGEAFVQAQSIAAQEGAGTLVYVGRFDVAEFAMVLEPEEPLRLARRVVYVALSALGDALTAHAPPGRIVSFGWPGRILVDAGVVGAGRLAWPASGSEDHVPDWIVFGGLIRTVSLGREAGVHSLASALEDEGFLEFSSDRLIEGFARHLMSRLDAWQSLGFDAIARDYVERLDVEKGAAAAIAENGDLLMKWRGTDEPERHSLVEALTSPSEFSNASHRRRQ